MAPFKVSVLLSLLFQSIVAWTIDLPDVRKHYFDKENNNYYQYYPNNEQTIHLPSLDVYKNSLEYEKNVFEEALSSNGFYDDNKRYNVAEIKTNDGLVYKDDAYFSNNLAGDNGVPGSQYARDYEYQSYMEKKVHEVVRSGSSYLEGLRKSLQQYTSELEGCTNNNLSSNNSSWRPQIEPKRRDESGKITTGSNIGIGQQSFTGGQQLNPGEIPLNTGGQPLNAGDLSISGELQYNAGEAPLNSGGLILNAGDPSISGGLQYNAGETPLNSGGKQLSSGAQRLNCSEANKAREHVRRVTELAMWAIRELQELEFSSTYQQRSSDEIEEKVLLLKLAWFLDRLAQLTGFKPDIPPTYAAANIDKTSNQVPLTEVTTKPVVAELSPIYPLDYPNKYHHVQRRSINQPLRDVVKYIIKHKIWVNSNPQSNNNEEISDKSEEFDVKNEIEHVINKRSVDEMTENSIQDLSYVLKPKPNVNYVKDKVKAEEIEFLVRKVKKSNRKTSAHEIRKLSDILNARVKRNTDNPDKVLPVKKRRAEYYERPILGRYPENPTGDISYYLKNKSGVRYNYDIAQVAQVRAGIQRVFDNGNIFVIDRYGFNNKGNPNPFMAGVIKTTSD